MNKYNNKKCEYNGINFDSQMELKFYLHLLELQKDGIVREIHLQPVYELLGAYEIEEKKVRAIKYKADFKVIYTDGHEEVIDIKGFTTTDFLIKKKLFEYKYKIPLHCITFSGIDDGWIKLDDLKKARKERKKLKEINKSNKI